MWSRRLLQQQKHIYHTVTSYIRFYEAVCVPTQIFHIFKNIVYHKTESTPPGQKRLFKDKKIAKTGWPLLGGLQDISSSKRPFPTAEPKKVLADDLNVIDCMFERGTLTPACPLQTTCRPHHSPGEQRMYFLQKHKQKHSLPQALSATSYPAVAESMLCASITPRFGAAAKQAQHRLHCTIRTAVRTISACPPSRSCTLEGSGSGQSKSLKTPHTLHTLALTSCPQVLQIPEQKQPEALLFQGHHSPELLISWIIPTVAFHSLLQYISNVAFQYASCTPYLHITYLIIPICISHTTFTLLLLLCVTCLKYYVLFVYHVDTCLFVHCWHLYIVDQSLIPCVC